jgi:hypothetical protein
LYHVRTQPKISSDDPPNSCSTNPPTHYTTVQYGSHFDLDLDLDLHLHLHVHLDDTHIHTTSPPLHFEDIQT